MIFDQFMPASYRNTYFDVKRQTDLFFLNNGDMDKIDRTPFGKRLYDARTHAKLTQEQAAKAAGMAQATLAEAEVSGKRSGYTVQLAALYSVSAVWLATGRGKMYLDTKELKQQALSSNRSSADLQHEVIELLSEMALKNQEDWLLCVKSAANYERWKREREQPPLEQKSETPPSIYKHPKHGGIRNAGNLIASEGKGGGGTKKRVFKK